MHYRYRKQLCLLFFCFVSTMGQSKDSKHVALGVSINIEIYDALNSRALYENQMIVMDGVVVDIGIGGVYTFKDKTGSITLHTEDDLEALNYSMTTKKAIFIYGHVDTTTTPNSINVVDAKRMQ